MERKLPCKKTTIRDLFPNATDDQLKEIEKTLHNYAAIAWRVCQRLEREKAGRFHGRKDVS